MLKLGTALPNDRNSVDDSYDVEIMLTFDIVEAMYIYLAHLEHVKYVST
jgi:hypothetical protein